MSSHDPFKPKPGMRLAVAPGLSPTKSPPQKHQPQGPRHSAVDAKRKDAKREPPQPVKKQPPPQSSGSLSSQHVSRVHRSPYDLSPAHDRDQQEQAADAQRVAMRHAASGASSGRRKDPKRHITFKLQENRLSLVEPPPKEEAAKYWFTESEKKVRKPLIFSVESNTAVSVQVAILMGVSAIHCEMPTAAKVAAASKKGLFGGGGVVPSPALASAVHNEGKRTFLDIKVRAIMTPIGLMPCEHGGGAKSAKGWVCAGSTGGELERIRLTLKPGIYFIRARGPANLTLFGEVVDIDRELV